MRLPSARLIVALAAILAGSLPPCVAAGAEGDGGACCFPSGGCAGPISPKRCAVLGGVYQGDGSSCDDVACSAVVGACCYPDGVCKHETALDCATRGGVYQGDASACESIACAPTTESCCFPATHACADLPPRDCHAVGGIPGGPTSACARGACTGCRIWTDADGDGLPDANLDRVAAAHETVAADIWIDSRDFEWSNYLVYVQWSPGMTLTYAKYRASGGTNFPLDDFSLPNGVGFGGAGFRERGVDLIASVKLRIDSPGLSCVTPVIDASNPHYVFSQLGRGAAYSLFAANPASCWRTHGRDRESVGAAPKRNGEPPAANALETTSWGRVKTLYR